MYEHHHQKLLSRSEFAKRATSHALLGLAIGVATLSGGVALYHFVAHLPWADAFLNAAMILGGMGPVDPMRSSAAKILAGCYALFAGLAFVAIVGVAMAPWAHRLLHKFHLEDDLRIDR